MPAPSHREGSCRNRTKEYRAWAHIKGRCLNPSDKSYPAYGGRGITISPVWAESFEAFLEDVGRAPSSDHSLDRIDNDGPYAHGNVRWADRHTQIRNTRRNIIVDGMCLVDFCRVNKLSYEAVQMRLRRGHPQPQAFSALTGAAYRKLIQGAQNV